MRALVSLVCLIALVASTLPVRGGGDPIQPGDSLGGFCTLNFVFDGVGPLAGRVYIGTAAHCVEPGDVADTDGNNNFGVAVFDDDADTDFALIEVFPAFRAGVLGTVRGNPGMPTGFTRAAETATGDVLLFSGYGLGFDLTAATREKRAGLLVSDTGRQYRADGPVVNGDSGGPILHQETGKALGIVSHYGLGGLPPTTDEGPVIEYAILKMSGAGFPVAIRRG